MEPEHPDKPEQKETKQLTAGEKSGSSLVEKVRDSGMALKDRAVEEV